MFLRGSALAGTVVETRERAAAAAKPALKCLMSIAPG
jgi:hypothetical protein